MTRYFHPNLARGQTSTNLSDVEHQRHGEVEVRVRATHVDPQVPRDRRHDHRDEHHAGDDQPVTNVCESNDMTLPVAVSDAYSERESSRSGGS